MDSVERSGRTLRLEQGDITRVEADAIVNAANGHLAGGGGVDGAIHRAGGPSILAEGQRIVARRNRPLQAGEAATTGAGSLPARFVIHAVGPVWHGGSGGEAEALGRAYRSSLQEAERHKARRVAFPSISTGAYRYPVEEAAEIALRTVLAFLDDEAAVVEEVVFVLYDADTYSVYRDALARLG